MSRLQLRPRIPSTICRVFYTPNGGYRGYFYGENSSRIFRSGCEYCIHAEMDVLQKLLRSRLIQRYFSLIVIRLDKKGNLKNSKPCHKCIQYMNYITTISPYIIKYIYWSDNQGKIIKSKLVDLMAEENKHYSRRFRKKKMIN